MVETNSTDASRTYKKRALIISTTKFSGFHRENNRLQLGWLVFSTVPHDISEQLARAVDEAKSLNAQIAQVKANAKETIEQAQKEQHAIQTEVSRLSAENERLKALMERVSSGVR